VETRGAVYGFDVRSALPFVYLRDPPSEPFDSWLEVTVEAGGPEPPDDVPPLLEWTARPDHPFHARLWAVEDRYDMWIDEMGGYSVWPSEPRVRVPADAAPVRREEGLWGVPSALCFTRRGDLPLHASAVEVDGAAILFAAPGMFGKTTLAAAFLDRGHRVLAEDLACCRLSLRDDPPAVLPGPALLRVRRDVVHRFGEIAGTRPVADDPERLHLAFDEGLRGTADAVPIAAVVVLRRTSSSIRLDRVDATSILPDLWVVSFNLPTDEDRARCFAGIVDLMDAVPTWTLDRPLSLDALPDVIDEVIATCR
jgi:hypothetical protein